jgi:hypothetical protein
MSITAMKLALDALEYEAKRSGDGAYLLEREALRQAIEQAEKQEPVAWESILGAVARGWCYEENANKTMDSDLAVAIAKEVQALYTTPQPQFGDTSAAYMVGVQDGKKQREWVGLTDEEIEEGIKQSWVTEQAFQSAAWWAEAKLRSKNNG